MGVPVEQQLLFWHDKELTASYDRKTLLDLHLHTGFSLKGYDMVGQKAHLDLMPPLSQQHESITCSALAKLKLRKAGYHYTVAPTTSLTGQMSPFNQESIKYINIRLVWEIKTAHND